MLIGGALQAAEPGNVAISEQTADSVTLSSGADRVYVRVLKPNLLQVDYRPDNKTSPNTLILDPAFSSKNWTAGTVSINDGASEVVLTTSAMVVRISKSPCRINVYHTDGTMRIFGEPSSGGMSDTRVKVEFDSGLNWYGIQSAPAQRGRDMDFKDVGSFTQKTMLTYLTRHNVTPAVDLNARTHGSQTGPFAWTTGAGSKPGFGLLWDNDGGSIAFASNTLEMNKTNEKVGKDAVSKSKLNTLWFAMVGTPGEINQAMIELSGRPQMFPKYAHGFGNTEWGINEQELHSHINAYRSRGIPLDHFILDFDWKAWDLNDYGNFAWNTRAKATPDTSEFDGFPSAPNGVLKGQLDSAGVKLMGITKPRIHLAPKSNPSALTPQGKDVTEGSPAGATWRHADSVGWWLPHGSPSDFKTDYWGSQRGRSDIVGNLNFFIPSARTWYGDKTIDHGFDGGIVGYWNDEGDEGPDPGDILDSSNFYNTLYQESIYTSQRSKKPGTRVWSMNRHSYLGAQRYGYSIWSGDIETDWRVLKVEAPRMLQAVNAGMARNGADAGGTAGNFNSVGSSGDKTDGVKKHVPTGELYARWLQFAALQPAFRIHGVYLCNRQPWLHGAEAEAAAADAIRLRSKLMPYIYAHDRIYSETGLPLVQPLIWEHPKDTNVANLGDEWMFGRYLLAAPILEPRASVTSPDESQSIGGTTVRKVYLPAGTWYDYFRGTAHVGPTTLDYQVQTSTLHDLPLYVRKGAIIPSHPEPLQHVAEKAVTTVRLDLFPDSAQTTFPYYDDDGVSYQYEGNAYFRQEITLQQNDGTVTVGLGAKQGTYTPALQHYLVAINKFAASAVTGFTSYASLANLEAAAGEGWAMGAGIHGTITYIKVAAGAARTITATGSAPAFAIATATLPAAIRNAPYDAQLGADGLGATATWSVTPALPAGLKLDPRTGRITGTPTAAGTASYTLQVSSGGTASKAINLTVSPAPFLAHEPFAYTSGGLDWNGRGGENGWAGPWVRYAGENGQGHLPVYPASYVPGLTVPGLPATGGAVQMATVLKMPGNQNSKKEADYGRALLTPFDAGTNGANAWVSFIGQGTSPGDGWFGIGLFKGTTEQLLVGQVWGQSNWGMQGPGGLQKLGGTSLATKSFVVINVRVVDGKRVVRMWLNPTPGASAPSDASRYVDLETDVDLSFDTIRVRGDSQVSKLTVDEIRVGSTFAEVCGITSTEPELDVSRTGAVSDAGTDTVTGSAAATPQNLNYVLTNSGTGSITITGSVVVAGLTNCTATVTTPPAASIGAGQSSTMVVSVTPGAAGAWSFTLSIDNNDSNESPYNWTVTGTADALPSPELDIARGGAVVVDGGTDSASDLVAGTARTITYVLTNSGTGALAVSGATISAQTNATATVSAQPATSIASGATSELVVSVTATAAGPWSITISVTSTDANENPYDWILSGTATAVQTGLLVSEPFLYDAGSLAGRNGGTGWTSAWDNGANNVVAPGLTMPEVAVSGNRANVTTASFRALPSRLPNGTWWVSFLAQSTNPGSEWGGVSFFDGGTEQLFMGQRFGSSVWGMEGSGKGALTTKASGNVSLIVVRLVLRDGSDDATMWIDPVDSSEPSAGNGSALAAFGELNPDRVRLGSGTTMRIDELRIGQTYTSVVSFTSTAAELDITRGGAAVVDGGSDSATGTVAGTARAMTYVLTNSGAAVLTLNGPATASAQTNCEVTLTQPGTSIAAGATANLVVSVKPIAAGPWSVTLTVASTDADENPYTWILSGTASATAGPNQGGSVGAGGTGDNGSAGGKRGCGLGSGFTVLLMLGVCIALGTRAGPQPSRRK